MTTTPDPRSKWVQTHSGRRVYPWADDAFPDSYQIEDVAHALSMLCRFNGHIKQFYSVAEHCVRVMWRLQEIEAAPACVLGGLLHDAGEAYVGDVPSPIKTQTPAIKRAEKNIVGHIHRKFNLGLTEADEAAIHLVDREMVFVEGRALLEHPEIMELWSFQPETHYAKYGRLKTPGWLPSHAKSVFLNEFKHALAAYQRDTK